LQYQYSRLLAVDPSLTASGWVLFSVADAQPLELGVLCPPGPKMNLADRYLVLQQEVQSLYSRLSLGINDVLVVEGPAPLVMNPNSALKVEGVRGIFESVARARKVAVPGRLNPRTVQTELLGMRGKQLSRKDVKEWARATAAQLFGDELLRLSGNSDASVSYDSISQDIIDAILIGTLAVARVKNSCQIGQELTAAFATKSKASFRRGRLLRR